MAHSKMLARQGIISKEDAEAIQQGLVTIMSEIDSGNFRFSDALEDIHMNVESRLEELIGRPAGFLHTGRSRNDQVATDFRMWLAEEIASADKGLRELIAALVDQAEKGAEIVMPGFTHLQVAQPVTWGHHMLAYVEMFTRDVERFKAAAWRTRWSPLGAAALAGTSFPIDPHWTAEELGLELALHNSMDAVSSRDFAIEYLASAAICGMHLSRLAEEIVLWTSARFQFASLGDRFTTGSSIMPQKRNPDAAELVRAKTGRLNGSLVALLTVMKALPLAYSKDLQEDKEQVFDAADTLSLMIAAMTGMIEDLKPNPERLAAAAGQGYSTATDLADWLVRVGGMPFREAHHVTGRLVRMAEEKGCGLEGLTLMEMKAVCDLITEDARAVLEVRRSVASRTSYGGTAPSFVHERIGFIRDWLEC